MPKKLTDNTASAPLDLKDRKLIAALDFNGRLSYTQLGKRIGMSKQGADYKLQSLIKRGIIKGFYPVINVPKLGYQYCRLLLTLQNTTKEKKEEIMHYLKEQENVFWLFELQGPYDILVALWAESMTEYKRFIDKLQEQYASFIKTKIETVATDVIHYQHRYLLGLKETKEIHLKETTERKKLDHLDKKILLCLCRDGRMPLVKIATTIGASAKVIAYRVRKLEKERIIEGYRPILDHQKIDYTYYKLFIAVTKAEKDSLKKIKEYIRSQPCVLYFVEGLGFPKTLDVEIVVQSMKELYAFINNLRFQFPTYIGEYETITFIDTVKVEFLPS